MNSNTSFPAQDSSSSNLTAASPRNEAVLRLGEKIASELELEDQADTLSLWMAHYVAELIQNAEAAGPQDRADEKAKCAAAILEIWKHRSQFPAGSRPIEDFEPILRALENLDPDRNGFRYLDSLRQMAADMETTPEAANWLSFADSVDSSARILISYCLARAAKDAMDASADWINLAKEADADKELDFVVVRTLSEKRDLLNATETNERARKRIEDRITHLEAFQAMAAGVASELRTQLGQCDSPEDET